ncbi:MAG: CBS domain-containing protein [Gemmatimonadota bacterium]
MRLSEILSEDRILVPLEAETLEEAIGLLCHGLETSGTLPKGAGPRLAGEFFSGARGEVIRVNEWVILAAARSEQVDRFTALQYRVYADTPLAEVVGLMVRQGIRAVPVVGQKLEFLGLITSGDAIRYLLPERLTGSKGGKEMGSLLAREVMVRSIMCISEDQSLVEAANLMVNKGVSQSVDSALHLLFGPGGRNTPDGNRESFRLSGT